MPLLLYQLKINNMKEENYTPEQIKQKAILDREEKERRISQLISREDVVKILNKYDDLYHTRMQVRTPEEQNILGNFLTVFMIDIISDVKALELKATGMNTESAQMIELFQMTGCVSVFELKRLFQKLQSQEEI